MPLKSGTSQRTVSQNIREMHQGKTYAHTKEKFGKATADKQAVAAAVNKQHQSMMGKGKKK
jgi:hypothetical protein